MSEDVNETGFNADAPTTQAIDAGSTPVGKEPTDVATDVVHPATPEAQATQTGADTDITRLLDDGDPEPLKVAEPVTPPAPSWMRDIEVEGLKCMQHIYDFGKGVGAEVVTFVTSGKRRVTPVAFKGVEINNFDYTGDSHMHANEDSANVHLSSLKENA